MQPIMSPASSTFVTYDEQYLSSTFLPEMIDRFKSMNLHQVILNIAQLESNIALNKELVVVLKNRRDVLLSNTTAETLPHTVSAELKKQDTLEVVDENFSYFTQEELNEHSSELEEASEREDAPAVSLQSSQDEADTPLGSTTETPIDSP